MPITQIKTPAYKSPREMLISWDSWRKGLNLLLRENEVNGGEMTLATNLMLKGSGIPTKRWGCQNFFKAGESGSVNYLGYTKKTNDDIEILALTDWGILTKKSGASYVTITGASWPSGSAIEGTQLGEKVYIISQARPWSRYDFTSLTNFATIATPTGAAVTNFSGVTGSSEWSWRVTAVSRSGGETLASTPVSLASMPQDLTRTLTKLSWSPVSTASGVLVGYNIYRGPLGDERWIGGVDNNTASFDDYGLATTDPTRVVPIADTTNGPKAKFILRYKDRLILAGVPNDPTKVLISARYDQHERFDAFAGGGSVWIEPDSGECYDEKTEVLTEFGWKKFKELDKTEKVLTMNPDSRNIEWQKPTKYMEYNHSGDMISLDSGRLDLLVTPNHRFFIENPKTKKGRFIEAKDIKKYSGNIPKTGLWHGVENNFFNIPTETFAAFLGIWLAEGSVLGSKTGRNPLTDGYVITITQKKEDTKLKIRELLKKTGWKWKEYKNGDDAINFTLNYKELWEYLSPLGNSHTKYIPEEVKNLPSKYLEILWDWMMLGDGNSYSSLLGKSNTKKYYTVSQKLADDVLEVLVKIGKSGVIRERKFPRKVSFGRVMPECLLYIITECRRRSFNFGNKTKKYISIKKYIGKTYCVSVPNTIIYVRRNGKPVFCGNSITGLGIHQEKLIVFKERSVWQLTLGSITYNNYLILDPQYQLLTASQGCTSHKSIVPVENDLMFANKNGVYILRYEPQLQNIINASEISAKIRPFFEGLTYEDVSQASAVYADKKYILSFPISKQSIIFDRERMCFIGPWKTPFGINRWLSYVDAGGINRWLGADSGDPYVSEFATSYPDDKGTAIQTIFKSKKEDFGDWTIFKTLNEAYLNFAEVKGDVSVNIYIEDRTGNVVNAKTFTLEGSGTEGNAGIGTDLIGDFLLGESNYEADSGGVEVPKKVFLYKTSRTFQLEIRTTGKTDNYNLLGVKVSAIGQSRGNAPSSWSV